MGATVIMFDLDDTLLDHGASVRAALDTWFPTIAAGTPRDHDAWVAAWFEAEECHFAAWRSGEISFAEQRRQRLRDVLPLLDRSDLAGASDDTLDGVFSGYADAYEASWRLFDDAFPALDHLQHNGLRLALLTNGIEAQQRAKVNVTGLDGRFEQVFTAEGLGVAKPARAAFTRACEALDVSPGQVLYVGDHPDVDVRAALDAGLLAMHVDRNGARTFPEHQRIESLAELPARLT